MIIYLKYRFQFLLLKSVYISQFHVYFYYISFFLFFFDIFLIYVSFFGIFRQNETEFDTEKNNIFNRCDAGSVVPGSHRYIFCVVHVQARYMLVWQPTSSSIFIPNASKLLFCGLSVCVGSFSTETIFIKKLNSFVFYLFL